jgi:hypothetical protein
MKDRCAEMLSVKIRTGQREFLELRAISKKTSLCAVTRELIDEAMARVGDEA